MAKAFLSKYLHSLVDHTGLPGVGGGASDWSSYAATADISAAGNDLINVNDVVLSGNLSGAASVSATDVSGISAYFTNVSATSWYNYPPSGNTIASATSAENAALLDGIDSTVFASAADLANYLQLTGGTINGDLEITGGLTAANISAATYQNMPGADLTPWSNYPATATISAGDMSASGSFTGVSARFTDVSATNYYNLPPSGEGADAWSSYPATADISAGNQDLLSGGSGYFTDISATNWYNYPPSGNTIASATSAEYATLAGSATDALSATSALESTSAVSAENAALLDGINSTVFASAADLANYLQLTGGTINGDLEVTGGLTAANISAATYQNMPGADLTPWSNYPATATISAGDMSASGSFTGVSAKFTDISGTNYYNLPPSGPGADAWSSYAATADISAGNQDLLSGGSGYFADISATNYFNLPPSGEGADAWSSKVASATISGEGNDLINLNDLIMTGNLSGAASLSATDISGLSAYFDTYVGIDTEASGWAAYPAVSAISAGDIDASGDVSGVSAYFTDISATNWYNYPPSGNTIASATSAEYASLAGSATDALSATSALSASRSLSATSATSALSASRSLSATSSTSALSASNADLLDGINSTVFASAADLANYLQLTGGTINGDLEITGGLTASNISATTYQNMPGADLTPWSNYPATATISAGNMSASGSFTGVSAKFTDISATNYYNLPPSGEGADAWSSYPATADISAGNQDLLSGGSGYFVDISATNYFNLPPSGEGAASWSSKVASANISAEGNDLINLNDLVMSGNLSGATSLSATKVSGLSAWFDTYVGIDTEASGWAAYPAVATISAGDMDASGDVSGVSAYFTDISATNWYNYPPSGNTIASATSAEYASLAGSATDALSATSALSASRSLSATSATSALSASNADLLDGINSTVFASAADLANYLQTTGGTINGDLEVTGTLSADTISATTYQNLPATDASTWASFPATADISAGNQDLLSGGSGYFADISATNYFNLPPSGEGAASWSSKVASATISAEGNDLINLNDLVMSGNLSGAASLSATDISAISGIMTNVSATNYFNLPPSGEGADAWSSYPATADISAGNQDLLSGGSGYFADISATNYFNLPPSGEGAASWSSKVASATVSAEGNDLINLNDLVMTGNLSGVASISATEVSGLSAWFDTYVGIDTEASGWAGYPAVSTISAGDIDASGDVSGVSAYFTDISATNWYNYPPSGNTIASATSAEYASLAGSSTDALSSTSALSASRSLSATSSTSALSASNADLLDGINSTVFASAADLADYLPITGGTINGDLEVTGTLSADTISAGTYQNLPPSGPGADAWSSYPATADISAGNQDLLSGGSGYFVDISATNYFNLPPSGEGAASWSSKVASANISGEGNDLINLNDLVMTGNLSGAASLSATEISGLSGYFTQVSATTYLNVPGGDSSDWSSYPATADISAGNQDLLSGGSGYFVDISATNYYNLPASGEGAASWSSKVASATISAEGNDLINVNDIVLSGNLSGAASLSATDISGLSGYYTQISATTYLNYPPSGNTIASATSAEYASLAGSATDALSATSALSASRSLSATSATDALSATSALSASRSLSATSATSALSASRSLSATSSTSALSASNADLLDGINSTVFASAVDLANYLQTTGGTINGDLEVTGTLSAATISATTYQNLPATDASTWASFPATADISAAGYDITGTSAYFVDISATNYFNLPPSGEGAASWSSKVASANISAEGNDLINVNDIVLSGNLSGAASLSATDISGLSGYYTQISATTYLNVPGGDSSDWSSYPATAAVSAGGQTLSAGTISATTYQNLPPSGEGAASWSSKVASANISGEGNDLINLNDLVMSGNLSGVASISATNTTAGSGYFTDVSATTYYNLPPSGEGAASWSSKVASATISAGGNDILSAKDVVLTGTVTAASAEFTGGYIDMSNGWTIEYNSSLSSLDFVYT